MATIEPLDLQRAAPPQHGADNGDQPLTGVRNAFSALVDSSSHGCALVMDGTVVYVNGALAGMLGYTPGELEGQRPEQFIADQDRDRVVEGMRRLLAGGSDEAVEYHARRKDGSLLPIEAISRAVRIDGKPAISSIVLDITERKRTEAALRESEQRLRAQYQALPVPTYTWRRSDDDFTLIDYNQAAVDRTRGTVARLFGMRFSDLYSDEPQIRHDLSRCWETKAVVRREMDYRMHSIGEDRHLDVTYVFVPPDLIQVHTLDITERTLAEAALRQSEERFRLLAEHAQDMIFRLRHGDSPGYDYVSPGAEAISGYPLHEWYADPVFAANLVHPDDREAFERMVQHPTSDPVVLRWIRKDGTVIWTERRSTAIYDESGRLVAVEGIIRDITERKRMEEALRQSEERFRLLAEHAQDMIFRYRLTEPVGFEYVSPAVTAMGGYTPEQYYADPNFAFNVVHRKDRETFARMILERITAPVELRWIRSDASVMWTEQRNTYVYDDTGALVAVEGIVRDITDRRRAAKAARRAREDLEGKVERQLQRRIPYGLTFRELTVLHLVAGGKADKEIAAELVISPLTVHKHVANILSKMNAASRTEAAMRASREGLLD